MIVLKFLLPVVNAENCARGFPNMNRLTNRTAQIGVDEEVGTRVGLNNLHIMSHMKFNCTGTITSLLLRAEIRTVTGSGTRAGISYPTISLWSVGVDDLGKPAYIKVDGSERSIVLGPSNFSTSGVIEYPLDPPLQFEDGNMLGWLQREDVVGIYLIETEQFISTAIVNWDLMSAVVAVSQTTILNQVLIIYPVIGELMVLTSGACTCMCMHMLMCANRCWVCLSYWSVPY